ncbi:DUF1460 domain-containing protein [Ancylothrix sp. C2]|uniref:DUF1460 domain-containing protein n=1 Tax=Ancylothrix sp. D3o TaxID=2953691 RepID=UPI0021BB1E1C|nr:DUF1460 domain-containing protein [Ancylothrix sp. D3o]MCT7948868.1 DUF1460 domain-containing protein [Ancylothrix sp. D3o]
MKKLLGLAIFTFPISYGVMLNFASLARVEQKQNSQAETQRFEPKITANIMAELASGGPAFQRNPISHPQDQGKFAALMQFAQKYQLSQRPFGEILQVIADKFLGAEYKAGLLDESNKETLIINLAQFDCVLFVETVLAMARGVAMQDYSTQTFANHLQDQRYRNGELNGYCSRLHYFSEWISDNEKRGNVTNITANLGGFTVNKTLSFMSQHRQSYPKLMNNEAEYQCVVNMENSLKSLKFNYIPTNQIYQVYNQLQPGDIIAIATDIEGLDVTHTGLVYRTGNEVGLIHASPNGVVKISPDLETFVSQVRDSIGIIVARPNDPRQRISGK